MDYYLQNENIINRLVEEYEKYGKLIIAYDFDNTVFDYHNKGVSFEQVKQLLRDCKDRAKFIVFTCCDESKYDFIKDYLDKNNLPYDTINENIHYMNQFKGRKVYYNILLDDRAGLQSAYDCLNKFNNIINKESV